MNDLKFKMFLFYHFNPPYRIENELISPVQISDIDSDFPIRDDGLSGSIRSMNRYMSEYSGFYYIWKNFAEKYDYIGLGHYGKIILPRKTGYNMSMSVPEFCSRHRELGFSKDKLAELFEHHDVALPEINKVSVDSIHFYAAEYIRKKFVFRTDEEMMKPLGGLNRKQYLTMRQHYASVHYQDDLERLLSAIEKTHGLHERNVCEKIADSIGEYNGNLVLMKWQIFDQFMAWSYPLMQHLMREIDFEAPRYTAENYQIRVLGFLSERMLNFFLRSRDFRISTGHPIALVNYPKLDTTSTEKISVSLAYLESLEKFDPNADKPFKSFLLRNFPYLVPPLHFFYRKLLIKRLMHQLQGN